MATPGACQRRRRGAVRGPTSLPKLAERLRHGHDKVRLFPAVGSRPVKGKMHHASGGQCGGAHIGHVYSQSGIPRRRIVERPPAIGTPADLPPQSKALEVS
jgi:hypothetical protein